MNFGHFFWGVLPRLAGPWPIDRVCNRFVIFTLSITRFFKYQFDYWRFFSDLNHVNFFGVYSPCSTAYCDSLGVYQSIWICAPNPLVNTRSANQYTFSFDTHLFPRRQLFFPVGNISKNLIWKLHVCSFIDWAPHLGSYSDPDAGLTSTYAAATAS